MLSPAEVRPVHLNHVIILCPEQGMEVETRSTAHSTKTSCATLIVAQISQTYTHPRNTTALHTPPPAAHRHLQIDVDIVEQQTVAFNAGPVL